MEWKDWEGKHVFIRTRHGKVYSGDVTEINSKSPKLTWLILNDKFNKSVQFSVDEIVEIKEEKVL